MLAVALIVFRESLEAALLVGILVAATKNLRNRGGWLTAGCVAGAAGAMAVALAVMRFPALLDGVNQELFNAAVLGIAVLMLGWHHLWMTRHAAELAANARQVANAVRGGDRTMAAVGAVAAMAVLREGSETALFLFGSITGGNLSAGDVVVGGAFGLLLGVATGVLVYSGLAHIPLRALFKVTGALLVLVAAGMASQASGLLIQADFMPPLAAPAWDTSRLVSADSALGVALHALVGYEPRPAATQVLAFGATLAAIILPARWVRSGAARSKAAGPASVTS